MSPKKPPSAQLLALFKRREAHAAQAPVAVTEYQARQKATIDRMHQLRELRLTREKQDVIPLAPK